MGRLKPRKPETLKRYEDARRARVLAAITGEWQTTNTVTAAVRGERVALVRALDQLQAAGEIERRDGPHGSHNYRLRRRARRAA